MQHLRLTLETPTENLALDEAMLDAGEAGEIDGGVLRMWEPKDYFVVLGRSSDPQREVHLPACRRDGVPILRRSSGGATIVAGPGCLMVAVVLSYADYPTLRAIDTAHRWVLEKMASALSNLAPGVERAGISDLVLPADVLPEDHAASTNDAPRKFSGNSLRCKQSHLLYHGTLLYDFDLERIGRWLQMPARQPDYRNARHHRQFVTNLAVSRDALESGLVQGWQAEKPLADWPRERTVTLAREKYSRADWTNCEK